MQQLRKRHLLDRRMHMQHAIKARRQNTLQLQQMDLGFERGYAVDRPAGRAEHEARLDILLLYAANAQPDLVAALGVLDLVFCFAVQGGDGDVVSVGHEKVVVCLFQHAGFDFAFDDGAHVLVLCIHRHHEWGVNFPLQRFEVVEVFEEGRAGVPGSELFGDAVFDADGGLGADGHEGDVVFGEAEGAEEGGELVDALPVALLAPLDCHVVHFVDGDDEPVDTLSFCENGVLARLSSLFKPGFVFSFASGDDKDADVGLGGAANHAGDKRFVPGGVEDSVSSFVCLEESAADLDRFALGAFFFCEVEGPGEVPGFTAGFLGFALVFVHGALVDHASSVEDTATQGRFAGVNMANED